MKCLKCNYENIDNSNFCVKCGNKLKEKCNCWIKEEQYNCEQEECPSYKLYMKIIQGK